MSLDKKNIFFPITIDQHFGVLAEENRHEEHIKQLIKQVLLTNPGERINRPDFGCGIRQMIFAPNSELNASLLQVIVIQSLEKWMGSLITTEDVKIKAENEKLEVTIVYSINTTQEREYLNVEINL